jgi:hypothetical protein
MERRYSSTVVYFCDFCGEYTFRVEYAPFLIHTWLDYIFIYCCTSGTVHSEIRCGFWHFGDQMYSCGLRHEGVLGIRYVLYQKYDTGKLVPSAGIIHF